MFCVLVDLVKLSLLTKWLARKTPLRKPNCGEGSSPQSPGRRVFMIFLVYCIVSLFNLCFCCPPALHNIYHTPMAQYRVFVLKVPLDTNKHSVLWHCWLGDRKGIRPGKIWILVCRWWWFDWSFARIIAPVITTTSIILCFNEHRLTQVHLENCR